MEASKIRAKRVASDKANSIRILIGCRLTYAYLLAPVLNDSDDASKGSSFRTGVLISKKAPAEALSVLRQAVTDAVNVGVKTKWGGRKPADLQLPLNDGDKKYQEDPEKYAEFKGMINFTAKRREEDGRPVLKKNGQIVDSAGQIESGDWCVVDVSFYPFSNKKKGVAVGLNAVTLIEEGERFSGGPSQTSIDEEANSLYGDLLAGLEDDPFGGAGQEDDPLAGLL